MEQTTRNVKTSDLFSAEMEPILMEWVAKLASPADLYASLPQLYAKLSTQNIQGKVEAGAIITGPVHIGEGSVVNPYAVICGPAILGNNVTVGSHAEIRDGSFIGSNCVLGHGCSIKHSMLMNRSQICHGVFVSNSILGFGSIVGPNAVLGPQESAPTGVDSSIPFPLGVVLGDYASVGASCVLRPGTIVGPRTVLSAGLVLAGIYEPD